MTARRMAGAGLLRRGRVADGLAPPILLSVNVSSGTEAGGTAITLTGTGFSQATSAQLNGVQCPSFVAVNDTTATCVTPAATFALSSTAASNLKNITIFTPGGSSTLVGCYTYTSEFARIAGGLYQFEYRANNPANSVTSGAIDNWPSYGANSGTLVGTSTARPTYEAAGWNGGPSGLGDGVDDSLKKTDITGFGNGLRPYVFVAIQRVAGSATTVPSTLISAVGNDGLVLKIDANTDWAMTRADNGVGATTTVISSSGTQKRLTERGFTTGGTNSFVLDGVGADNARTNPSGANMTQFALFSDNGGTGNANVRIVWALVLNDEPTAQQRIDIRAAAKSAMWIGYTNSSLNLP